MPIYEYQCDACEGIFDALRKLSDPPLTQCRLCQAEGQVRKNVTAPAFRLKGSGWYETDFKKGGKRNLAGGDSSSSGSGSGSGSGGSASGGAKSEAPKASSSGDS
jgi:putative FmdB family regulatory protein